MVDRDRVEVRLGRLASQLEALARVRDAGWAAYRDDSEARAATERRLQLAIQICIDIGAHLISEANVRGAEDYPAVFSRLVDIDVIDRELAERLRGAARQRNLLVHMYLEIDDAKVYATLDHLDDLRRFAAAVQALLESEES